MIVVEEVYAADHPPLGYRTDRRISDFLPQGSRNGPRLADCKGSFKPTHWFARDRRCEFQCIVHFHKLAISIDKGFVAFPPIRGSSDALQQREECGGAL